MALFNRSNQKQQSVLPDEVSQYYQAQKRERTGVAIVLGIIALVVTLAIGAGLFLGGRYVYRKFTEEDKATKTVETAQPATSTPESEKTNVGNGQASDEGASTAPAVTPTATPGPAVAPPATTPNLGDEPALPSTGDEGH